jgi:hypothetical protein
MRLILLALSFLSLFSCSSGMRYIDEPNDCARILFQLNGGNTLYMSFESLLGDDEPIVAEGTWKKVSDSIVEFNITKCSHKIINLSALFEQDYFERVTSNTFRFDCSKETIIIWGIVCSKNSPLR